MRRQRRGGRIAAGMRFACGRAGGQMTRLVPHFLIIGAMKSGTTTLHDDLRSSDEFALSDIKEPAILATSSDEAEAERRYTRHFARLRGDIRGEASTVYTQQPRHPDVALRARAVCGPELRLVMIMRDPVERILSHLRHDLAAGRFRPGEEARVVEELPDYIAASDYPARLRPWVAAFGAERLLCVPFDALRRDRVAAVRGVVRFLGGDPARVRPGNEVSNPSGGQRGIAPGPVARLVRSDLYRYSLRHLLPAPVRETVRRFVAGSPVAADVCLPPDLLARLRERFAGIEGELAALTGQRVRLGAGEGAGNE